MELAISRIIWRNRKTTNKKMADDKQISEQNESFEKAYEREFALQAELERVEIAYVKTVEKYGDYQDCKSFVEYLRTIEKIFLEAKARNWDSETNKHELIKAKIKSLAESKTVSEEVLASIYDDFRKAGSDINKLYEIVNQLLEKYSEDLECKEFILYIQYLYINFQNAEKDKLSMEELKERLVRARMEVLASDGSPELIMLENIYTEFKNLLNK